VATPSKTGDKVKISESSKTSIAGKACDTGKTGHTGKTGDTGKSVHRFFSCKKPVFRYFKNTGFKTGIPIHRTGLDTSSTPNKPYEQKYVAAFRNPIQPNVQATTHSY